MEGNVIQPNGAVSGGSGIPYIDDMPAITITDTSRFTRVNGGYEVIGNKCYFNLLLKLAFNLASSLPDGDYARLFSTWNSRIVDVPSPKGNTIPKMDVSWYKSDYPEEVISYGNAYVYVDASNNKETLFVTTIVNLDGTNNDIYVLIRGEYDV